MNRLISLFLLSTFALNTFAAERVKPIRSVSLIPASDPKLHDVSYKSAAPILVPFASWVVYFDGKEKSKQLTQALQSRNPGYGNLITSHISKRLTDKGYKVDLLTDIKRPEDNPDDIDYEKITFDSDIALQVYIQNMDFYEKLSSVVYEPRIYANSIAFTPLGKDYPFEDGYNFGADAEPGNIYAIAAPESANFKNFESMMSNVDGVDAVLRDGLIKVADKIADSFIESFPLDTNPERLSPQK